MDATTITAISGAIVLVGTAVWKALEKILAYARQRAQDEAAERALVRQDRAQERTEDREERATERAEDRKAWVTAAEKFGASSEARHHEIMGALGALECAPGKVH